MYLNQYQERIQDSHISGMGLLTKINNCLKPFFESSLLAVWLNPEIDSDFSGGKLAIMYYIIFRFTYVNIVDKLIDK